MRKAEIKGKILSVAVAVLMVGLMLVGLVSISRPANAQLALSASTQVYLYPQNSGAPFCDTVNAEIRVNATEFQAGQIKLIYNSICADVTNWVRNSTDFPLGTWQSDTPGEEWITFTATSPMSGSYLIGTLTIHGLCEMADCSTTLDFVDPSKLFDQSGNEIAANWIDGTFQCGIVQPFWTVPIVANAGPEGSNTDLEFGTHPDATDEYDSGIDLPSPPPQPGALFEAYFSIVHTLFPRLNKDLRGETPNEWTLDVRSTDEDIELSWNTDDAPQGVALRLIGAEAEIDMKAVNSIILAAGVHTITVVAEQIEAGRHYLTISSTAGGSVTKPGEGTFAYDEGTVVSLVADADEGYGFVSWTGDVDTVADVKTTSTIINIDNDYDITANFEEISSPPPTSTLYTLATNSTDGGSVSTPGEGTFKYDGGTVVDLVADVGEGYQFVSWTGDVDTIADVEATSTTISMQGDYSITANFEKTPPVNWALISGIIAVVVVVVVVTFFVRRRSRRLEYTGG